MEEQQQIKGFKFGILYAKEGQKKEDEMFSNGDTQDMDTDPNVSQQFKDFLQFVGHRVDLLNWRGYRGGLDVRSVTTGRQSVYKEFNNNPIMFHVSTLLPFSRADRQQLERKRHIGNDLVVIIFQDGDTPYRPTTISSRQVHVVIVVREVRINEEIFYRIACVSREEVPIFGPVIPSNVLFERGENFLKFFLCQITKC
eukprot:TRINITY_DN3141_c0_g1_i3.p1 TRINITY_DN3141_c0_g1~~TRINITY_DN3141_c0_g1_i3.p1  ORF type:complete len:198 (-),score=41.63 TRINITY_DN3141_c0_g1_i3:132-725(-)